MKLQILENGKSYTYTVLFLLGLMLDIIKYFKVTMIQLWFTLITTLESDTPKKIMLNSMVYTKAFHCCFY